MFWKLSENAKYSTCPLLQWAWKEPQNCLHCTQQSPPRFLCGNQCSNVPFLCSPGKHIFFCGTLRSTPTPPRLGITITICNSPGAALCPRRRSLVFWRRQKWSWSMTARDVQHMGRQGNSTGSPWPYSTKHHKIVLYRFTCDKQHPTTSILASEPAPDLCTPSHCLWGEKFLLPTSVNCTTPAN